MPHSLASGGFYGSHNVWKMLRKESVAPQGSGPSWWRPASIGLVLIYVVWGYSPFPTTELLLLSVLGHKLNIWVGFCCGIFFFLLGFFLFFEMFWGCFSVFLWRWQESSCKTCTAIERVGRLGFYCFPSWAEQFSFLLSSWPFGGGKGREQFL